MSAPVAGRSVPGASALAGVGAVALALFRDVGGMTVLALRSALALVPPRIEPRELLRSFFRFGWQSLPVVTATAFFTGVIVVLQSATYVERYGATLLVGWGAGFTTFREIGPVLIALMISGRVGSNNTAELASMRITEQIDALRALAVDPYRYLVIPRILALVAVTFGLTVIGDLFAVVGGALSAWLLVKVPLVTYWHSFSDYVHLADLFQGLVKSAVFGWAVAVVSCHFGLSVEGGASAVGRAVNRSVVASAVFIFLVDWLLTWLMA